MALIYEDEFGEVFFRDGPTERTLVTFNGLGVYADGKRFWAQPIAERLGLRCIGIISRGETWFPAPFMHGVLGVAVPLLTGRVFIYGSSMGGYAALKYSAALGADTILAFSPQATISPVTLPGNPYAAFFKNDLHHDMEIGASDIAGKAYVFSDNYHAEDRRQLALLPKCKDLETVPVSFLRHDTNAIVNNGRVIEELFELCLSRNRAGIDALVRRAKRVSPATYFNLGVTLCSHKKLVWAPAAIERARTLGLAASKMSQFYLPFGAALESAARYSDAIDSFRLAAESQPVNPGVQHAYINALVRLGRVAEARDALDRAMTSCPDARGLIALKTAIAA